MSFFMVLSLVQGYCIIFKFNNISILYYVFVNLIKKIFHLTQFSICPITHKVFYKYILLILFSIFGPTNKYKN